MLEVGHARIVTIMDTNNSYVGKPRTRRKPHTPRRETTQSREKSITTDTDELSFYTELAINILKDVKIQHRELLPHGCRLRLQKEYERDAVEIRRRVSCEGLSFLTKTLPSLAKAVDTAFANGAPFEAAGFEQNPCTSLPRFLGGLLQLIFVIPFSSQELNHGLAQGHIDLETSQGLLPGYDSIGDKPTLIDQSGDSWLREWNICRPIWQRIGEDPHDITIVRYSPLVSSPMQSALALKLVRQICYAFYKLNIPYAEKEEHKVLCDFVATDKGLERFAHGFFSDSSDILRMARGLISRVLCSSDPRGVIPRHGPGAVATGERNHQKARFQRFYKRLNEFYPYDTFFFFNHSHLCDRLQELESFEVQEAGTAKVVLVPKDSRGPRLISCEPLEIQWIQQGLMRVLVETIKTHPLTKGRVNFADQGVNRGLAQRSSCVSSWNNLVTLDLKEASDRVSVALVRELFPPLWFDALMACRSDNTMLPDGRLVTLNKFAPMGSAVCFPVEALCFWALSVSAASVHLKRSLDSTVRLLTGETPSIDTPSHPGFVYVYGDDIICSGQFVTEIRSIFDSVGLALNESKCCVHGFFRESCGMDSYFGCPVTPTRFRRRWSSRYSPESHLSWVAYSNLLYSNGYHCSATFIADCVQAIRNTPYVNKGVAKEGDDAGDEPGFVAFCRPLTRSHQASLNKPFRMRFNTHLQRREILADVVKPQQVTGAHDGWEEMLRIASISGGNKPTTPQGDPLSDPYDVMVTADEYSVRRRVKLKRRWMPMP